MSSSFFSLQALLWLAIQLSISVLVLWIAVIRCRQGSTGGRIMLAGAVTFVLAAIALRIIPFLDLGRFSGRGVSAFNDSMMVITTVSAISSSGLVLFLVGVLLHALRGGSESARIVELEAIIRDRDEGGSRR